MEVGGGRGEDVAADAGRSKRRRLTSNTPSDPDVDKIGHNGRTTVTHICLICSVKFEQRIPKIQHSNRSEKDIPMGAKILDEFEIFFTLEKCLGLPVEECEKFFTDLAEMEGEPGNWGLSFCPYHAATIKQAKEIDILISELERKLSKLKKTLCNAVGDSMESNSSDDCPIQNSGFQMIRQVIALHKGIPIEGTTNQRTRKSKRTLRQGKVKSKRMRSEANLPASSPWTVEYPETPADFCMTESDIKVEIEPSIKVEFEGAPTPDMQIFESESGKWMDILDSNVGDNDLNDEDGSPPSPTITPVSERSSRKKPVKSKKKYEKAKKLLTKARSLPPVKPTAPRGRVKCTICSSKFPTKADRDNHYTTTHGEKIAPRYSCTMCDNSYASKTSLNNHMQKIHTPESFPCDQCTKSFPCEADRRQHELRKHSDQAIQILNCPECNKELTGVYSLRSHIQRVHRRIGPKIAKKKHKLVCELCSKVYANGQDFRKHQAKEHSLTTYEPSVCDQCGKVLCDAKSLRKHKLSQHIGGYKYTCNLCGSKSLFKSHFDTHMKKTHGVDTKNDHCGEVGTSTSTTLPVEPGTPTKVTPGQGCSSSQNIQTQIEQMLRDSQKFECFKCGEDFESKE